MIGGTGVARELVLRAISTRMWWREQGLLAVHGRRFSEAASKKGAMVRSKRRSQAGDSDPQGGLRED